MKVYSFVRTVSTDSDYDESEDSYTQTSNACLAKWHNPDDSFLVLFAKLSACSATWHDEDRVCLDEIYGDVDFELDTQTPYA